MAHCYAPAGYDMGYPVFFDNNIPQERAQEVLQYMLGG
jgi:hypothetical protein